jgi:hypothetical protein
MKKSLLVFMWPIFLLSMAIACTASYLMGLPIAETNAFGAIWVISFPAGIFCSLKAFQRYKKTDWPHVG